MRSISLYLVLVVRSSSHSWTLSNSGSLHITVTQDVILSCTSGASIPPSLPCRALRTAPTSRRASRQPHRPLTTPVASGTWKRQVHLWASFASLEGRKDTKDAKTWCLWKVHASWRHQSVSGRQSTSPKDMASSFLRPSLTSLTLSSYNLTPSNSSYR